DDYLTCDSPLTTTITTSVRAFELNPTPDLLPNTSYRVTIGTGVTTAANVPFASAYHWEFKTKSGTTPCPIANVTIPNCGVTYNSPFNHSLPAQVSDTACNTVDGSTLTYDWTNTEPTKVCTLIVGNTGPTNLCSGPSDPLANATTTVTAKTEGKTSNACKITFDSTFCSTDAQCQQNANGLCGPAGTSQCINNRCTPVVTSVDPDNGKIGTW